MKKVYRWALMLCLLVSLGGCTPKHDHKGKTPLVEVDGSFLYQEDLQAALPLNLSADDSVLFAENYIRNWIEDALLFGKAEDNAKLFGMRRQFTECSFGHVEIELVFIMEVGRANYLVYAAFFRRSQHSNRFFQIRCSVIYAVQNVAMYVYHLRFPVFLKFIFLKPSFVHIDVLRFFFLRLPFL